MATLLLFCEDAVSATLYRCDRARARSGAAGGVRRPPPSPAPATGDSSLTIFIRGVEVGRMQSTVSHRRHELGHLVDRPLRRHRAEPAARSSTTPTGSRRHCASKRRKSRSALRPADLVRPDHRHQRDLPGRRDDRPRPTRCRRARVVLPNNFYAAMKRSRCGWRASAPGAEIPLYVPPQGEVKAVGQGRRRGIDPDAGRHRPPLRTYTLSIHNAGARRRRHHGGRRAAIGSRGSRYQAAAL